MSFEAFYSGTKRISAVIRKILNVLIIAIGLVMVLVVLLQVFSRFIFNLGISWTEETARTLFVYMIFIGVALVEDDNTQVRITFLIDKLPRIPKFILNTIILICEFLFIVFVFIGAFEIWETAASITYISMQTVTYQVLYVPFFIGMPLCMWFLFMQELAEIQKTFYPELSEEPEAEETFEVSADELAEYIGSDE